MVFYTLSNGEEVEITIKEGDDYRTFLCICLFGSSYCISYEIEPGKNLNLNEILSDIEKNYSKYKEEYRNLFYSGMWGFGLKK